MAYPNLDEDLVNELLKDGRASLRSLGEELDVSVTTVSNHLEQLSSDNKINGFAPIVNYDAWGYDTTCVINISVDGSTLTEFTDRLKDHPNMVSIYETTGDFDVVAIGKFEDTDHMNSEIKTLLDDDSVEDTNTTVVLNTVRDHEQFQLPTTEEDE